ncbi:hypothetical protein D3C71_1298250 [compost metagenome]
MQQPDGNNDGPLARIVDLSHQTRSPGHGEEAGHDERLAQVVGEGHLPDGGEDPAHHAQAARGQQDQAAGVGQGDEDRIGGHDLGPTAGGLNARSSRDLAPFQQAQNRQNDAADRDQGQIDVGRHAAVEEAGLEQAQAQHHQRHGREDVAEQAHALQEAPGLEVLDQAGGPAAAIGGDAGGHGALGQAQGFVAQGVGQGGGAVGRHPQGCGLHGRQPQGGGSAEQDQGARRHGAHQHDEQAGPGVEQQDVAVPEGGAVDQAEQGQPEQPPPQQPPARLVPAFAADQKDRHAEQHGEQGDELLMEEDLDRPVGHGRGADQGKGRLLGRHGRIHGQGESRGVDRQDA